MEAVPDGALWDRRVPPRFREGSHGLARALFLSSERTRSHARCCVPNLHLQIYIKVHDMYVYIHTGVCEKTLLRRRIPLGKLARKTPNQGLECSFCHRTAGQGLAQKEWSFTDTGSTSAVGSRQLASVVLACRQKIIVHR